MNSSLRCTLCLIAFLMVSTVRGQKIQQSPPLIVPAANGSPNAPSDAVVLLEGDDLCGFSNADDWNRHKEFVSVAGKKNGIETKQAFGDCQLHLEFATPPKLSGNGKNRGNSGVYFMGLYEVQILDSFDNETYANGQCGALYAQTPPLVNVCRKPGEWQSYDIVFTAPRFDERGKLIKKARCTVFQNGVLIQNNVAFKGPTDIRPESSYSEHAAKLPLKIQNHRCPVRFRNIWIRELANETEAELATESKGWVQLLDDRLSQWDKFLGVPHPSVKGLPEGTATSENFKAGTPLGLNNDPLKVFTVNSTSGETVVRVTGQIYGALTSKEEFSNYRLKMQFKWGDTKYTPRMKLGRDSGLLYHSVGDYGAYCSTWMDSLECQIMERDYGDLFCLGNTSARVRNNSPDRGRPIFQQDGKESRLRICRRLDDYGHPTEWNTAEVLTIGNRAIHVINGRVVMVLTDAKIGQEETGSDLSSGKIQIQSEGAELFVRRILIKPIKSFPKELLGQLKLDQDLQQIE